MKRIYTKCLIPVIAIAMFIAPAQSSNASIANDICVAGCDAQAGEDLIVCGTEYAAALAACVYATAHTPGFDSNACNATARSNRDTCNATVATTKGTCISQCPAE
jgi:hypothetical protein